MEQGAGSWERREVPGETPATTRGTRVLPSDAGLRAYLKIPWGAVFDLKAGWRGVTREHTLHGSATEEQRSQTACRVKTPVAVSLLSVGGVGSASTARCGDAGDRAEAPSPPCPQPKSFTAAPLAIFRPALMSSGIMPRLTALTQVGQPAVKMILSFHRK